MLTPLSQARKAQGRLLQAAVTLGFDATLGSQAEILVQETLTTAAIEGENLDRDAVRSSVARRLGLPTAGFPTSNRNIEGLVDVLQDASNNYEKPMTLKRLHSWQAALFPTGYSGFHKIKTGGWRGPEPMRVVSGGIGKEHVHFEAPPARLLAKEMDHFLQWWDHDSRPLDGLLRAGVAHLYFVTLHPYEDGNGRIARVLTDMALAQDEKMNQRFYSLSARIMAERRQYYDALETSQKGSLDISPWLEWFLGCFFRALQDSEKVISKTLDITRFWHAHAQTALNVRQRKVVGKLLEAGPQGFEGGLTTRKYIAMTKTSRASAFREISDLVEKGILISQKGRGRSTAYEIKWP